MSTQQGEGRCGGSRDPDPRESAGGSIPSARPPLGQSAGDSTWTPASGPPRLGPPRVGESWCDCTPVPGQWVSRPWGRWVLAALWEAVRTTPAHPGEDRPDAATGGNGARSPSAPGTPRASGSAPLPSLGAAAERF